MKICNSIINTVTLKQQSSILCEVCNRKIDKTKLREHLETHKNYFKFKCGSCKFTSKSEQEISQHVEFDHKNLTNASYSATELTFYCKYSNNSSPTDEFCQFTSTDFFDMQAHITTCSFQFSKRSYPCPVCNENFQTKPKADEHLYLYHGNVANFVCGVQGCEYKSLEFNVQTHIRQAHPTVFEDTQYNTIQEIKPIWTCENGCHYSTNNQNAAFHHLNTCQNKNLYCLECHTHFNQATAFRSHMAIFHTEFYSMKCAHCNIHFKCEINLRDHVDKEHKLPFSSNDDKQILLDKIWICKLKNCRFSTEKGESDLMKHVHDVHFGLSVRDYKRISCHEAKLVIKDKTAAKCKGCKMNFKNQSHVNRHRLNGCVKIKTDEIVAGRLKGCKCQDFIDIFDKYKGELTSGETFNVLASHATFCQNYSDYNFENKSCIFYDITFVFFYKTLTLFTPLWSSF